MSITGTLNHAELHCTAGGEMTLSASIELIDDTLGSVGIRRIEINDPAVNASVVQYVAQWLPALSSAAGFAVTFPVAPTE